MFQENRILNYPIFDFLKKVVLRNPFLDMTVGAFLPFIFYLLTYLPNATSYTSQE